MPRRPSRLSEMPGIGVDRLGNAADALQDSTVLRLENLDTDLRPWAGALEETRRAVDDDVISAGGLSGILNVLLATIEPGDEVVLTEPIYAGLLNRVRLAGGVPRLARLVPGKDGWRLDPESFRDAVRAPRVRELVSPFPPDRNSVPALSGALPLLSGARDLTARL